MCRNIKPLLHVDPGATDAELRAASLQYVRKISGFRKPSKVNEPAFHMAVEEIAAASARLIGSLRERVPAKDRKGEVANARTGAEAGRRGTP